MPATTENLSEKIVDKKGDIISKEFEKLNSENHSKNENEIIFYRPIFYKESKTVRDIDIDYVKLIELYYSWGYRRYDVGIEFIFIRVENNVIQQVTSQQILDHLIDYIDSLPDTLTYPEKSCEIPKKILKQKIFRCPQNYRNNERLALLKNKQEIILNADTKHECFIYFSNGFVYCNKDGWELRPYTDLEGTYIWENQIIKRNFLKQNLENKEISELGEYAQFVFNVCGGMENRYYSLCSIIGYLLSSFMDTKLKAIIFTDSSLSELSNGRTGKTLMGQSFGHIKKEMEIPGKDFDHTNKNKYQELSLDTQIVFLNDVRKNFDFEVLFNDITEGVRVEKKNQHPFRRKTKILISTNKTIKIEGGSSEDRCVEFEFSDYYHAGFGPDNEFGHRFFSEWTEKQWNQFDNFMMFCLSVYLGNGIIKPVNMNLNRRKLLSETDPLFVEFIEDQIKEKSIVFEEKYLKASLHDKFLDEYPELKEDKRKGRREIFTTWLKKFALYDERFQSKTTETKSGKDRSITFHAAKS